METTPLDTAALPVLLCHFQDRTTSLVHDAVTKTLTITLQPLLTLTNKTKTA